MGQSNKYHNLYLDILKIGMSCLGSGLSYGDLQAELEKKGYDFSNDCIELAVKQQFIDNYHHFLSEEDKQSKGELRTVEDLDKHHLECNFVLKGNACLAYVEHRTSKNNLMIAYAALIIAGLSLLCQVIPLSQEKNLKENDTIELKEAPMTTIQIIKDTSTATLQIKEKDAKTQPVDPE